MKKFYTKENFILKFILLLFTTILIHATEVREVIQTYENSRFNFFVEYSSDIFVNKKYPINGDGVWLTSKDEEIKLTLSGSHAVLFSNIKEAYVQYLEWTKEDKGTEITYKIQKKNWFVLSGYRNNKKSIFYEKRFFYKETLVGYVLEYPTKEKDKYSRLIKGLNSSFRVGE